jgi:putative membrane protein
LPLGLVPQFAEIGQEMSLTHPIVGSLFIWFSIPFYVIVAWIFHTMEKIGRTGENPFEGSANDVPISTISRGIEIDLRQNLGEPLDAIPKQIPMIFDTQM